MTQPDYEQKKRECFVKFCKDNGIDQEVNISIFDAFDQIFDRAYALGKQENDMEDTVIQGWVARNKWGGLFIFRENEKSEISLDDKGRWSAIKVNKKDGRLISWVGSSGEQLGYPLDKCFPSLTWESDPQEVEIIIKRKKK